jgi:hypothetical protein
LMNTNAIKLAKVNYDIDNNDLKSILTDWCMLETNSSFERNERKTSPDAISHLISK